MYRKNVEYVRMAVRILVRSFESHPSNTITDISPDQLAHNYYIRIETKRFCTVCNTIYPNASNYVPCNLLVLPQYRIGVAIFTEK